MMRKLLGLVAVGLIAFSVYRLSGILSRYEVGQEFYQEVSNQIISPNSVDANPPLASEILPLTVDFESLSQVNDDVVGWIYSDDTPINYPVVQADDNQYYFHRLIDHSEDFAGSIFMDYRNASDFSDLNTILYGHNMKNQSMFGTLQAYNDQDYFDTHPILYLLTPKQAYKIELIASFGTNHTSDIYQIPDTYEKQIELLDYAKQLSLFTSDVSFEKDDRLITLSTCDVEYDTARFVLIGKLSEVGG